MYLGRQLSEISLGLLSLPELTPPAATALVSFALTAKREPLQAIAVHETDMSADKLVGRDMDIRRSERRIL